MGARLATNSAKLPELLTKTGGRLGPSPEAPVVNHEVNAASHSGQKGERGGGGQACRSTKHAAKESWLKRSFRQIGSQKFCGLFPSRILWEVCEIALAVR